MVFLVLGAFLLKYHGNTLQLPSRFSTHVIEGKRKIACTNSNYEGPITFISYFCAFGDFYSYFVKQNCCVVVS